MSEPLTDFALEISYLAHVIALGDPAHMASRERLSPLDCAVVEHGKILAAAYDMHARGEDVDSLTLYADLEKAAAPRRLLDALAAIHSGQVRMEPPGHMADRLRALARARRVRKLLLQGIASAEKMHVEDALEMVREALGEERSGDREQPLQAGEVCRLAMAEICESIATRPRLRSGMPKLDDAVKGFPPATLTVVGGDTGAGKSSLLLAMVVNMIERQGARVGWVSVEDPIAVCGPRVLSHVCDLNTELLEEGKITGEMRDEARRGIEVAERMGLHFRFVLSRPLPDVVGAMRDLVLTRACNVLVVDYVQAIALAGDDRRKAMIDALRQLKGAAQELNVPLLLASQLSRGDADFREPSKRSLKEAGELENMAEAIVLLWQTSDREGAPVLGKVAKVKWSPKRPRFQVLRNPRGAVCGLGDPPAAPADGIGNGFRRKAAPMTNGYGYDD